MADLDLSRLLQGGMDLAKVFGRGDDVYRTTMEKQAQVEGLVADAAQKRNAALARRDGAAMLRDQGTPEGNMLALALEGQIDPKYFGIGSKSNEAFTLSPGSKRFDAANRVVAEVPFAPANGNLVNIADGNSGTMQMVWDPRTRQLAPLPQVGAASAQSAGMRYEDGTPVNVTRGVGPNGIPFNFDPDLKPEHRQWAMADIANNAESDTYTRTQPPSATARFGHTPPKQPDQYSTLSPNEVTALGLPAGTIAQRSPSGQVQIINKPRDLPTGGQVIDNGDGTTTYIPAGKITEGERNASGFYQRMIAANAEMRRLEAAGYDPTNRRDYYTAGGEYLNPLASTEGQQYRQAQDNWLRANLRKESGAAIGVAEMDQERKNYFPIPGDSPETIQQKARNRTVTERAMRSAAGGGLPSTTPAASNSGGWSIQRVE